jgi:hypothetical protein
MLNMNTRNTLLAGLAAVAVTTSASAADIVIRLTGSTAFRALTHTSLVAATPTGLGFTQTAYTGITATGTASASGAKYAIYEKGTSPNKITLKTSWTGSVGGIQAVAEQRTDVKWLPDVGTSSVVGGSANNESLAATDGIPADIAFSDSYQSSTVFKTPTLTDTVFGVVQFRMVTNYGVGGVNPITSINYQQARALFSSNSGLPLSMFTNNPADTAKVYGIGRDPDSGTRITFLAESGIGANTSVIHWSPTSAGGTVSGISGNNITALEQWPASTLFGINYAVGNGGYASGGDLSKVMRFDTSAVSVNGGTAAPCYFIAFVGKSDADAVLAVTGVGAGPGKVIPFANQDSNALTSAQVADSMKNGTNPLWSYQHAMHNGLTGDKLQFYTDMTTLLTTANSSNIVYGQMQVERIGDGGTITAK